MVTADYDAVVLSLMSFAAIAILISGLDDLFIDVCYYAGRLADALGDGQAPATEAELRALPEQRIAIMIPAWHEDAVIGRMLRNTLGTVDYGSFDIFVGVYPNDEPTMLAVAAVAESEPRIHRVVCPHDGPTNKADCLNWIIEGIRLHDKATGRRAAILMLHDSEDLVHPLSLRLMNRYIPEAAMVQLPVIPFESPASEMTAGTYLDEFAESHLKDMIVRERLSGMVPSAGVGTGFSRDAIEKLALKHDNQVFNVGTFTEDYDLAFRLNAIGQRSRLLQYTVERTELERGRLKIVRELVGTREYFPSSFRDAVRQKARWTLGIVFHGWEQRGWEGGPALRYMIWRDRKALLTNTVNILGYLLMLEVLIQPTARFIPGDGWLWRVIEIDALLSLNRCAQRVACIARVSCWKQAVLSIPRIVWGNVINFCAVARATFIYFKTKATGKKLVWAKTAHAFPTEAQLVNYKRKLGDLLLERRRLSLAHLVEGLRLQKESGRRLGDVLVDAGFASEEEVVAALATQLRVEWRRLEYDRLRREDLDLILECASREHLMVVADGSSRPVVIAAAVIGDARMKAWLDSNFPMPYRVVQAGRRNIIEIVERASRDRASLHAPGVRAVDGLSPPPMMH